MTAPPPPLRRPACVRVCVWACCWAGSPRGASPLATVARAALAFPAPCDPRTPSSRRTSWHEGTSRRPQRWAAVGGGRWGGWLGSCVTCAVRYRLLFAVVARMAVPCTCTGTRRCRCCCGEDPLQKKKEGYSVSVGVLAFLAFVVIGSGTLKGRCFVLLLWSCCCCCRCMFVHGA